MIHSHCKAIHMGTTVVPVMSILMSVSCWVCPVLYKQSRNIIKIKKIVKCFEYFKQWFLLLLHN